MLCHHSSYHKKHISTKTQHDGPASLVAQRDGNLVKRLFTAEASTRLRNNVKRVWSSIRERQKIGCVDNTVQLLPPWSTCPLSFPFTTPASAATCTSITIAFINLLGLFARFDLFARLGIAVLHR